MQIRNGIVEAIGNTPLIKLEHASELTGCTILGKAEFMNPGQSVKDRAALFIIEDAVKRGTLKPGGIIVEGTAGNTGIGLALVANALGYRTVIVIPDTQSQEKKDTLRLCGAELIEVPAVPYANPNNYVKVSGRLAEQLDKREPQGAIWANQFDNVANRQGHFETTGPEIFAQTEGKVDGFVCAVGTGGTLAGVGIALKDRKPAVKIALADPLGAALYSYYTRGVLNRWAPRCTAITRAASSSRKDLRSPKASARAASPRIWKARRSTSPIRSPTRKRCRSSSTCSSTRACVSAAPRASMSPARSGSPRRWARAT